MDIIKLRAQHPRKIIILILILFLTGYAMFKIVRMYKIATLPYVEPWIRVTPNVRELSNSVGNAYYLFYGVLPPLGEYPPGAPETIDFVNKYNELYIGNIYMPRTTILVISCDFETGKIYTGFSNVEVAQRNPGVAKMRISDDIYYRNAKGEPYMGGDTILRLAAILKSDDLYILKKRYDK